MRLLAIFILLYDPPYTQEKWEYDPHKHEYLQHCTCNNSNVETIQMASVMNANSKLAECLPYDGILFGDDKEGKTDACSNMNVLLKHYNERSQAQATTYCMTSFI